MDDKDKSYDLSHVSEDSEEEESSSLMSRKLVDQNNYLESGLQL